MKPERRKLEEKEINPAGLPDPPRNEPEGVRQRTGEPLGHEKSEQPPADRGPYEQESTSQGSE
jgi:hypothetical protein